MALDFTNKLTLPKELDFNVSFQPTLFNGKKYVIDASTGDYIGIVGDGFTCASHGEFYHRVWSTIEDQLGVDNVADATMTWRTGRKQAFAMLDIQFPSTKTTIENDMFSTTVAQRVIALHGVDGLCSNQVFFGAIDFFCLNGMVTGDHDKIRRKNTSNFDINIFIKELSNSTNDFYIQMNRVQRWATTSIKHMDIKTILDSLMKSKRKSEKMYSLYRQEVSKRGENLFALHSAFTNYASYADERNGFSLRNTGNDTSSVSMWLREQEVSKWVSSPEFRRLEVA